MGGVEMLFGLGASLRPSTCLWQILMALVKPAFALKGSGWEDWASVIV